MTKIGFTAPDDTAGALLVAEESCFMFSQKVSVSEKDFKSVYQLKHRRPRCLRTLDRTQAETSCYVQLLQGSFSLKSSFWESGCSLFLFNIKERGFFSTLTALHLPLHDLDSFPKLS